MAFIVGTSAAQTLNGTEFDDTMQGLGSGDRLFGFAGNDILFGGEGNDLLTGGLGADILHGGDGLDSAGYGEATGPVLADLELGYSSGPDGSDTFRSIEGLFGSAFDDRLIGDSGENFLRGQLGNDVIDGRGGVDFATYVDAPASVNVNLATGVVSGGGGADTLLHIEGVFGSAFADVLVGDAGENVLQGDLGNDVLDGGAGFDTVRYSSAPAAVTVNLATGTAIGGQGNDTLTGFEAIYGSGFADLLIGDGGRNTIWGIEGDDRLAGGAGDDTLDGGSGTDFADYSGAAGAMVIHLGNRTTSGPDGADILIAIEGAIGSAFADQFIGSEGADFFRPLGGNDVIDGAGGIDWIWFNDSTLGVTVDMGAGLATFPDGGRDTFVNIEAIAGSPQNDTITGSDGNDDISGGPGDDKLVGGLGVDRLFVRATTAGVSVDLQLGKASGGHGSDTLAGFEDVVGSDFNDTLIGDVFGNTLNGRLGDDTINGGDGIDTATYANASGGVSADLNAGSATGGDGTDVLLNIENLVGTPFDDTLVGHAGANKLTGASGNDVLEGRGDQDTLDGGSGTDFASYASASGAVTVNLAIGSVIGPDGSDTLISIEGVFGTAFVDTLVGSDVTNFLRGNAGDDTLDGGAGNDYADYRTAPGTVQVDLRTGRSAGADGVDILINIESVRGSNFDDTLTGDAGPNSLRGMGGNDTIDGGLGEDWFELSNAPNGVFVDLVDGTATGEGSDVIRGIENVRGSLFDDWLKGDGFANVLRGDDGSDLLDGRGGSDTALYLGARGSFDVSKVRNVFVMHDRSADEDTDQLVSIERVQFSDVTLPLANLPRTSAPEYGKDRGFLFDGVYYLLANQDLGAIVPLEGALDHYLNIGAAQLRTPNAWFDAGYYAARWPDLTSLNLPESTLFQHYNLFGVWEGRSAGPRFDRFDGNRYLSDNPDVAGYVDANLGAFLGSRSNGAIAHFIIYGADEQRVAYDSNGAVVDMGYVL